MQSQKAFLNFIMEHEVELKTALKLNLLKLGIYDEGIATDVFHDSIIAVWEIANKGRKIRNFKSYFFKTFMHQYRAIKQEEEKWENIKPYAPYFSDEEERKKKERQKEAAEKLDRIKDYLEELYGKEECIIYLNYMEAKANNKFYNMRQHAKKIGISIHRLMTISANMNKDIRQPQIMQFLKLEQFD